MRTLIGLAAGCLIFSIGLMAQSSGKPLTLEQRLKAIEDRDAILKVLNQYAYLVDFGHDVSQYTDLYTDDAIFQPTRRTARRPPAPASPSAARVSKNGSPTNGRCANG
jgi:SnoaL-like domain